MRDSLSQTIAKHLADSNVGLFRSQLYAKIGSAAVDGNIDKISHALNAMLREGHVDKSARHGVEGSRWSLTPKGRAAYSVLNNETDDTTDDELHGEDLSPEQVAQKLAELSEGTVRKVNTNIDDERDDYLPEHLQHQSNAPDPTLEFLDDRNINTAFLRFDTTDTLDRALYGLVKLIRDAAEQSTIERKAEKIQLLERLENNDLLPGDVRSMLFGIRMDLQQLETTP